MAASDRVPLRPEPTASPASRALTIAGVMVVVAVVALLVAVFRPQPNPNLLWQQARVAFEARDFPQAQTLLETLGRLRAPTDDDLMLRAQVLIGLNRETDALADLNRVPDSHRMAAAARLEVGQIERKRNRFAAAEAAFRDSIRLDPSQIKARRELIYLLGIELRRQDLDQMFRELAERTTLDGPEVFLWSLSKGLVWDAEENSHTLRKVVDAEPDNRLARLSLAEALFDLNRFDEAEAALAPLPDADPDARTRRAQLALARGDTAQVDALLASGPTDHLGLALLRGKQALAQGDAAEAIQHYRIAYRLGPQVREAVQGLAQALRLNHDPEAAAAQDLARRLDLLQGLIDKMATLPNRGDKDLIRRLGAACTAVGRLAEARSWYGLLVAQDPLDQAAQAAISRLRAAEAKPKAGGEDATPSPPRGGH